MSNVAAVFEFRLSKNDLDAQQVIDELKKIAKKFVFQLEKGEQKGYLHYQGRLSLIKKTTQHAALKLFDGLSIPPPEYLEPTITAEHRKAAFYQMKEQTRIDGPWTEQSATVYIPRQFRDIELYPFQFDILETRKDFNTRTINCIYDVNGNIGKSTVAAIAELKYNAIDLPPINDAKQLMEVMYGECIMRDTNKPGLVFLDMPRSMNKDTLNGIYSAIEQIKKGKIYDIRHSFKSLWIDSPTIWVFTNTMPDLDALSSDRWIFWQVENNELVRFEPKPEIVNPRHKKVVKIIRNN